MTVQRLPIVNGDDGVWGDILNQYISKEHYNTGVDNAANGGHNTITIRPGTTAAGTAPLKFTSGSLLITPEIGAVEFLGDKLYFTQTTGPTRKVLAAYDDSSGATGDVYYRDSSGNFVRLGIGSSNQVLTVTSGIPAWGAPSGGSSSESVAIVTGNITAGSDQVLLVDATTGAINVTLPAANTKTGKTYRIKKTDSTTNLVTIIPNGAETIDGYVNMIVAYHNSTIDIVSNGNYWYIV